jgi:hypothetical protein
LSQQRKVVDAGLRRHDEVGVAGESKGEAGDDLGYVNRPDLISFLFA